MGLVSEENSTAYVKAHITVMLKRSNLAMVRLKRSTDPSTSTHFTDQLPKASKVMLYKGHGEWTNGCNVGSVAAEYLRRPQGNDDHFHIRKVMQKTVGLGQESAQVVSSSDLVKACHLLLILEDLCTGDVCKPSPASTAHTSSRSSEWVRCT